MRPFLITHTSSQSGERPPGLLQCSTPSMPLTSSRSDASSGDSRGMRGAAIVGETLVAVHLALVPVHHAHYFCSSVFIIHH